MCVGCGTVEQLQPQYTRSHKKTSAHWGVARVGGGGEVEVEVQVEEGSSGSEVEVKEKKKRKNREK